MPITGNVTLEELIAEILKLDRSAVVTALQSSAQPLYQAIFDKGHAAATARFTPEKTQLEGQVANLTTQLTAKDEQIRQLSEKAPDVARLQQEHTENVRKLEEKHTNDLKAMQATLNAERMSRSERDLVTHLTGLGVDAEYAEVVLVNAKRNNRLRQNAKGIVEAFRADADVPFAPTADKDGIRLLAEELKGAVPAKFIVANVDTGSGTRSDPSQPAGSSKGAQQFKQIRDDVKAKEKATAPTSSAMDRLQGTAKSA